MKIVEGLKNGKVSIPLMIIIFLSIAIPTQLRKNNAKKGIAKYRKLSVAITYDCIKNFRSSMPVVYYKFYYKTILYHGSVSFNMRKRGDICEDYKFLVEFDSTNPSNNNLLLDSSILTDVYKSI